MDPSSIRQRRVHSFWTSFVRFAVGAAFAAAIWNFGLVGVQTGIVSGARWFADHSGATRASEVWRATGRAKVDHAATTGYQFLRQSAASVLDYLDFGSPSNRTFERVGRAAAAGSRSLVDKGTATQSKSATDKTR